MAYPIDEKLVVAVASSALFDLSDSHAVFEERGEAVYREYQREHEAEPLQPGVAYPFVRRLLALNGREHLKRPVEVVLLSRNDPDTGMRVRRSIEHYDLDISRGAFCGGREPYRYMKAFNARLFLSHNANDVRAAMGDGFAAGQVLPGESVVEDDDDDLTLRIAFDFDGVLANDESERIFQEQGMDAFHEWERNNADVPMPPGPLQPLLHSLAKIQQQEWAQRDEDPSYQPALRIAVVTARNAPSDRRVIHTLRHWAVSVDEAFFLGGIDKHRFLEVLRPNIFFDDQELHLETAKAVVPSVHIPVWRTPPPGEGLSQE